MKIHHSCPGCRYAEMSVFFENRLAPVFCNVLWESREAAITSPRATIRLACCQRCGLIYNIAFDPSLLDYDRKYENSLHYSSRFQRYAEDLAHRLVRRHNLYHKDVVEIGCGQGNFLSMLASAGDNRGVGFDPGFDPARAAAVTQDTVKIFPEHFSQNRNLCPADIICCRQVLEHIANPLDFLCSIRRMIGNRPETIVFFEVPNALYTLKDLGIWDIIYEHCSYFTARSLREIFQRAGFEPIEVAEQYDGQYLTIEAYPRIHTRRSIGESDSADHSIEKLAGDFNRAYRTKKSSWRRTLAELKEKEYRTVVWGAGSKGIMFLNTLNLSHRSIQYVIDLNPHKHGRFLTGTGQEIVPPEFLQTYLPQAVVIMNPIYQPEIKQTIQSMALTAEILLA